MTTEPADLVRGKGQFLDDLRFPGMLHLKVIRSIHARARILSVPPSLVGRDLHVVLPSTGEGAAAGITGVGEPAVAQEVVNYVGQPVGGVLAPTLAEAEDLASSVEVQYDPLPPVVTIDQALHSPPIHPGTPSNVMTEFTLGERFGDLRAPVVLEDRFKIARVAANPLETRGAVATFAGGRLTLYASTQSVFSVRGGLSQTLGLPAASVRVVQTDTGGAFGSKGSLYPEYVLLAHAAMRTGHPVKWTETRREHLTSSRHGRGTEGHVTLHAGRDGRVLALEAEILVDAGAYLCGLNGSTPRFIGFQLTGPYGIPRAYVHARGFYTNKVPLGPYRGAGRPEAAFLVERMMDRLADEVGLDPVEVRRRNATDAPTRTPLGLELPASRPFLEEAVSALSCPSPLPPGTGFCLFVLVPALAPGEGARLRVQDGRLEVGLGSHNHGQAHSAWTRSLLVEELGVPPDRIVIYPADTDFLARGIGSWGSRSAMAGGAALVAAARRLRREVEERTGGFDVDRLLNGSWDVTLFEQQSGQMNSLGANLVRATVDPLGRVTVEAVLAHYDLGRVLVQRAAESQVVGGTLQAIGETLSEEMVYDEAGQVLTGSLADAGLLPSSPATPVRVEFHGTPSPIPPGAKGVGESPTVGVPPALVRALETALEHRITDLPVRPPQILAWRRRAPLPVPSP
jgi:carbon-monoxide dehydrogenase large subunit